jgi:hypothetical protein
VALLAAAARLAAPLAVLLHIKPPPLANFRPLLIFASIRAPVLANLGSLVILALLLSPWLLGLGTLPIILHIGRSVRPPVLADFRTP